MVELSTDCDNRFIALRAESDPDSDETDVLRVIYESSFPLTERLPFDEMIAYIRSGRRRLLVAECDSTVVGFAITSELVCEVQLLEYLAVRSKQRSKGTGRRILDEVSGRLEKEGRRGLLFEVEPQGRGNASEREDRKRRIAFYERAGATIVSGAPRYVMPNLADGQPLEMVLMWLAPDETPAPTGCLLRHCVRSLLEDGYGLSTADPLIRRNLDALVC